MLESSRLAVMTMQLLVELVLRRVLIVLQENLDLVVHLVADVVAAEDGRDQHDAEADGC